MPERFEINRFIHDSTLIARVVSADELFGFFTREFVVPPAVIALAYGEARQPCLFSAGATIDGAGVLELLLVRSVPFTLEYTLVNLPSKDNVPFDATIRAAVMVIPERVELEAFRRTVLTSRREARAERLHLYCEDVIRTAAAGFVSERPAEALVDPAIWQKFDEALDTSFRELGFASGLSLGSDPRITLHSIAYEESRREARSSEIRNRRAQEDAARRDAAAKARESHLTEITAMIGKLKSVAGAEGAYKVADIIRTFDPAQRGSLYLGLLSASAPQSTATSILLIAGGDLLWADPANVSAVARRQPLPPNAGALRSVRVVRTDLGRRILVGARHGVHVMNETGEDLQSFSFTPSAELRGGVNAATIAGQMLFATHSEIGLMFWDLGEAGVLRRGLTDFTEGSKAVRDVQTDEAGRVWLAVDNIVIGWSPGKEAPFFAQPSPSEVTTLLIADGYAFAGLRDGAIVRWLADDSKPKLEIVRPAMGKAVQSLDWLAGGGIPRLLVGDGRPHLDLLVLGDSYAGQYRCLHELRWGFATDDVIAAVNDRRDHLFVWSPDAPELPRGALAVGRLIGRSIQDVAIL